MKYLIAVENAEIGDREIQSVSARQLYEGLGLDKSNWRRWSSDNIEENEFFKEKADWEGFVIMTNGNETKDYSISLDFAKHIAMMARTAKSHEYRNYMLDCEKRAKNNALGMAQTAAISELQKEVAALHAKINAFSKPIQRISNAQKNAGLEDDILNAVKSEVDGNEYIAFSQLHNAVERHHNNSSPLSPRKTATALTILGYYFLTRCWVNGHRERIWTSTCLAPSVTDAKKYVSIKLLA